MSLKVWLPLNGDLHNQGCSNYTISIARGSETYNNSGKIGKCFYSNGVNTLKITNIIPDIYNYSSYSLSAWFYIETNNTSHTGSSIISSGNWNQQLLNLAVSDWSTDHYTKLRISGSNWLRTYNYNFYKNTWYHAVVCDDGTHTYGYVNGTLIGNTAASFLPSSIEGNNIYIGGATYSTSMQFFGKINDVRIYDHCLSAAEVKEISQGLVLHYKLDTLDIQSGTNLVTGVTAGGRTTVLTDGRTGVQTAGVNQDTYFTINLSENIVAGTSYLFTCDASGISEGQYWGFPLGAQANNGVLPFKIYNGHNVYPFTANSTKSDGTTMDWGTKRLFMDDISRGDWANQACFYNFQLIKIGASDTIIKVEDSSGYNHNGTINGNIVISSDTNRYNCSAQFDGVDDSITVPYNAICPENIFTFNLWFKKDALGSKNYETLFGGPSGFEMDTRAGSATTLSLYMASTRSTKRNLVTELSLGNWYMITMTRDGTKEKYYVNGIYQSEIDAKTMPTGVYRIGAWASNTGQNYYGLISDFRIYCTALDADAIRQLYEVGAKIDNKKNLHTYELIENSPSIKINKRGQTLCNELQEGTAMKFYKTDSIIETHVLNEF